MWSMLRLCKALSGTNQNVVPGYSQIALRLVYYYAFFFVYDSVMLYIFSTSSVLIPFLRGCVSCLQVQTLSLVILKPNTSSYLLGELHFLGAWVILVQSLWYRPMHIQGYDWTMSRHISQLYSWRSIDMCGLYICFGQLYRRSSFWISPYIVAALSACAWYWYVMAALSACVSHWHLVKAFSACVPYYVLISFDSSGDRLSRYIHMLTLWTFGFLLQVSILFLDLVDYI